MRAVLLRVRSQLRRRWPATVAVALTIAVVSGAVLTLVAGARRTAHAPDAYTASVGGDVAATVQQQSGRPRTKAVAALPGVRSVEAITFAFASILDRGVPDPQTLAFTGTRPPSERIVSGRLASPRDFHEFVADESFAKRHHAHIGQTFSIWTWTQQQGAHGLGFNAAPKGPKFEGRLVGIFNTPSRLDDDYSTIDFSPALLHQDVGLVATIMSVRGGRGLTTARVRAEVDTLPGGAAFDVQPGVVVSSNIRNAVDAQALGTWLMSIALGVAALIALGQLLTRHTRLADSDRQPLAAMGFTRSDLAAESVLSAAVAAVLGLALGIVLAFVASGRFPAGFVRELEPHRGDRIDATALLLGGAVLLAALLVWVAVAVGFLNAAAARRRRARTPSDAIARRIPSPSASVGAQFALNGRDGSGRGAAGTIGVLALVMAGIVGSTVFATSLDRLVFDRARYGSNYTFAVGDNSDATATRLRQKLVGAPGVEGVMILTGADARAGGTTVGVVGLDPAQGGLAPHVLTGRLPGGPDEVALGRLTARSLHSGVGARVELAGQHRGSFRVVGTVVIPTVGGNDGVGEGAVVTATGFRRLTTHPDVTMAGVSVRGGVSTASQKRLTKEAGYPVGLEDPPGVIVNVRRVRRVPGILAGLLAALVLLALFHALVVSIQNRRHDVAILRALGADGRWVGRAVHWQATALTAAPLVVGVPLGLVAGSVAFRVFVGHIGAVPDPELPLLVVIGMVVVLFAIANLVAVVPSRRARTTATATMLKAE